MGLKSSGAIERELTAAGPHTVEQYYYSYCGVDSTVEVVMHTNGAPAPAPPATRVQADILYKYPSGISPK